MSSEVFMSLSIEHDNRCLVCTQHGSRLDGAFGMGTAPRHCSLSDAVGSLVT